MFCAPGFRLPNSVGWHQLLVPCGGGAGCESLLRECLPAVCQHPRWMTSSRWWSTLFLCVLDFVAFVIFFPACNFFSNLWNPSYQTVSNKYFGFSHWIWTSTFHYVQTAVTRNWFFWLNFRVLWKALRRNDVQKQISMVKIFLGPVLREGPDSQRPPHQSPHPKTWTPKPSPPTAIQVVLTLNEIATRKHFFTYKIIKQW